METQDTAKRFDHMARLIWNGATVIDEPALSQAQVQARCGELKGTIQKRFKGDFQDFKAYLRSQSWAQFIYPNL